MRFIAMPELCGWGYKCMSVRRYCIEFILDGPVHIGNGNWYSKKDYFISNNKIAILDVKKFVNSLNPGQFRDYCEFLENNSRKGDKGDLHSFLNKHGLMKVAQQSIAYSVESKLDRAPRGALRFHDVFEFVKDPYGNPYIPGSSVKGMLRTALLNCIILEDHSLVKHYDPLQSGEINDGNRSGNITRADKKLEKAAFWLEQPDEFDTSIKNDVMRYISVSDSEPLSCNDLVFVKKYDKFCKEDDGTPKHDIGKKTDYEGNPLDIYRECLRPSTAVSVIVDIDSRIDKYLPFMLDARGLEHAFIRSYELYKKCFLDYFGDDENSESDSAKADGRCCYITESGPLAGRRCRNHAVEGTRFCNTHKDKANAESGSPSSNSAICYLGGGVDFDSKTVMNALFDDSKDRVSKIAKVLYNQFPTKIDKNHYLVLWEKVKSAGFDPKEFSARTKKDGRLDKAKEDHRHWRDNKFGVSPHTLKLGLIGKKRLPMGKCSVTIKEQK